MTMTSTRSCSVSHHIPPITSHAVYRAIINQKAPLVASERPSSRPIQTLMVVSYPTFVNGSSLSKMPTPLHGCWRLYPSYLSSCINLKIRYKNTMVKNTMVTSCSVSFQSIMRSSLQLTTTINRLGLLWLGMCLERKKSKPNDYAVGTEGRITKTNAVHDDGDTHFRY